jgi:hypothetical protein
MEQAEWSKVIKECQDSGISIRSWCDQHGIKYNKYLYWARKLNPSQEVQQWAKLQAPSTVTKNEIIVSCGNWTITVDNDTSIDLLTDVIKAVNSACC